MGETVIPEERLRVFISSAQSNENGFAWSDVRRRIKECLSACPYLNPFIIEDNPSTTPSLQFFQSQLRKADLTVLLVKGEVRKRNGCGVCASHQMEKASPNIFFKR